MFLTTQGKFCTQNQIDICPQEKPHSSQEHMKLACFFQSEVRAENNSDILRNVSVIPKNKAFWSGRTLSMSSRESVCHLPDQIVVNGNSHMNVIHAQAQAQALIIWEKSVV